MENINPLLLSLLAAIVVSLVSLVGIVAFFLSRKKIDNILFYLISFAAGAFLANVFFELIPEALASISDQSIVFLHVLAGVILFFIIEKIICWRHCHINAQEHKHSLAYMNIVGDLLHNFLDGIAIMAAFYMDPVLGLATTITVVFHEIPQEISDFGILLYSGFSVKKAAFYNFLTALSSVAGVVFASLLLEAFTKASAYLVAITAGGFIYLAVADLMPELHKKSKAKDGFLQVFLIILGISAIILLQKLFDH